MHPNRPPHLNQIWISRPVFFITTVVHNRQPILANPDFESILIDEWKRALDKHGWAVGEYVIMPNHLHFFAREANANSKEITAFLAHWKQWTAKRITSLQFNKSGQLWQAGFFDRLLRSESEWDEKRAYMQQNPVRAGLVANSGDWKFQGDLDMFRV
jgi:REP element-mobilizing transposase RayT